MEYAKARPIADELVREFAPYCESGRCEVAGSLRRGKAEVGDIEIVCMPVLAVDLFGNPSAGRCAIDGAIDEMLVEGRLGSISKAGFRYCQFALPEGIKLDLFMVRPPAQWGVIFAIRTGPEKFSQWIVTPRRKRGALPSDCRVKGGAVHRGGSAIPMPEERDFFGLLGLGWVAPADRRAEMDVYVG